MMMDRVIPAEFIVAGNLIDSGTKEFQKAFSYALLSTEGERKTAGLIHILVLILTRDSRILWRIFCVSISVEEFMQTCEIFTSTGGNFNDVYSNAILEHRFNMCDILRDWKQSIFPNKVTYIASIVAKNTDALKYILDHHLTDFQFVRRQCLNFVFEDNPDLKNFMDFHYKEKMDALERKRRRHLEDSQLVGGVNI